MFLDEIGDLDLGLQAKLLRVLQESSVLSLGEDHEAPVNVRFVAATNRDLERAVSEGKFRVDLFHRLRVLLIQVPALRERTSDLPLLVEHFVRKHHARNGEVTPGISEEFVDALEHLELPGNVRQVENLVCEALVNHQGDGELGLHDLPITVLRQLTEAFEQTPGSAAKMAIPWACAPCHLTPHRMSEFSKLILDGTGWNVRRAMDECERSFFEAAIQRAGGNQTEAARLLGITPRCAYNKLRKHNVPLR